MSEQFKQNEIEAKKIYSDVLWMQIPTTIYLLFIGIVGTFGNLSIIFLTFRSKSLRQSCNYLLALLCAASFTHQLGLYTMAYIVFSGITYIPFKTCLYWQTVPLIGNMFVEMLPLLIGCDRFISFFFPIFHRQMNRTKFITTNIAICFVYSAILVFSAYFYANDYANDAVNCGVIEGLPENVSYGHFLSCATINCLAVLCYVVVWIGLNRNKSIRESNNQIFKCMAFIVITIFIGWFSVSILRIVFISILKVGPIPMFYLKIYGVICINTTCASQSFILLWFSKEYKQEFVKMFKCRKVNDPKPSTMLFVKSTLNTRFPNQ